MNHQSAAVSQAAAVLLAVKLKHCSLNDPNIPIVYVVSASQIFRGRENQSNLTKGLISQASMIDCTYIIMDPSLLVPRPKFPMTRLLTALS